MKRTSTIALIVGLLAVAGPPDPTAAQSSAAPASSTSKTSIKTLTRAEFEALIAQPQKVLLLDVRQPDEISVNGGFPVYLSVQADALVDHLAAIPRERAIVTVSNHANRAIRAGELLAEHGFTIAGAIGSETYEQAGGAVVHIAPHSARNGQAKEQ